MKIFEPSDFEINNVYGDMKESLKIACAEIANTKLNKLNLEFCKHEEVYDMYIDDGVCKAICLSCNQELEAIWKTKGKV
jgi:hypothetical protein